jgi:trigger factor
MKIDQLLNKGLNREYKVVVSAKDIDAKVDAELEGMKKKINLPGFRPGKAPLSLLKKLHGKGMRGQVLETIVTEGVDKIYKDENIKPAMQPKVDIVKFEEDEDLEFTLGVEILPEVKVPDFKKIKLDRLITEVNPKQLEEALDRLASSQKNFSAAAKATKAKAGDAVKMDFVGKVDGKEFDGGKAEGFQLELGSNQFIPGFEDQLIGCKAGDSKTVKVSFPKEYNSAELAGKDAEFAVTVHEVLKEGKVKINDDFAKNLGLDSLDALKESISGQIGQEHASLTAAVLKRSLLDALADMVKFEVPTGMVDMEFAQIWEQIKRDMINSGEAKEADFEGLTGPTDKKEQKEYRSIAERRVRLGLLLSEVGQARDVQISPEEVNRKIMQEAQKFPGQEKEVFDFYQKNENALAQLRAPIYEEKVCELILGDATVKEKTVTLEALQKAFQVAEEDEVETPKKTPKKKAAAKKEPAKKAAPKKAAAKKPAAKKAPAKKAAAKK